MSLTMNTPRLFQESKKRKKSITQRMHYLKTSLKYLIKSNFRKITTNEDASLKSCFAKGSAFIFCAIGTNASKVHCDGTVLFSADAEGIWVNWLVVSKSIYDTTTNG